MPGTLACRRKKMKTSEKILTAEMTEKQSREAGFTLLEVIIAISILTVGLLAVAAMQTSAIRGNDSAYHVTEGATWAQDRLEFLMALPYEDSALSNGTGKTDPMSPPDDYTITYDVVDDFPILNTKTITVRASRNDRGATKTRQLISVKSEL
jgi:prepilin-type N-terminal cleavage/methylation domain-containing protein